MVFSPGCTASFIVRSAMSRHVAPLGQYHAWCVSHMATDTSWFPDGISTPEEVPWFSTAVDWQDIILEDAAHDVDLRASIDNLSDAFWH